MVPDPKGGPDVEVGVWFRWPTSERQIKYPFITIDAIAAEPEYSPVPLGAHLEPTEGSVPAVGVAHAA